MAHAIILAAGSSSRMRTPKPLLSLDGKPLVAHHVAQLAPAVASLMVVLGWAWEAVAACLPPNTAWVVNPNWARDGQVESLQCGLLALPPGPVLVQPVDVPPVSSHLIRALLASGGSAVPTWHGRRGHPVLLSGALADRLRSALPAQGLRAVLTDAEEVPTDEEQTVMNLNRPRDWAAWLRHLQTVRGMQRA